MRKVFKISGMTCVNCQRTIEIGLKKLKGIKEVDVSLILERAIVSFDENTLTKEDIIKKIDELGYKASVIEESGILNLYIEKVDCVSEGCILLQKEDLESLKGVKKAIINPIKQTIYIEYDQDQISQEDIMAFIRSKGYEANLIESDKSKQTIIKILFGISSGIVIMLLDHTSVVYKSYIQMVLALLVQIYTGKDFYKGAIAGLKAKTGNMDLLVALGSFVATFYSILIVFGFLKGQTFFDTPTFLVSFVLIGKFIEYKLRTRASAYLKNVSSLNLRKARIISEDKEVIVDSYSLKIGDTLVLKAGDRVPIDVEILEGEAYVDTSFINGEFEPQHVKKPDLVISGSTLKSGYLKAKVINVAEKSFINELIRASNVSLEKRPNIQLLADKVSSYFVQFVIFLSTLTFFIWKIIIGVPTEEAINFAVASLVVSCPCAMGIAVPISIMMGVSNALKNGILIKNSKALEILKNANVFVIDKTGTITEGKFSVVKEEMFEDKNYICSIVKTAEKISNHPIAKALYNNCSSYEEQEDLACEEIQNFGIKCKDIFITDISFWNKNSESKAIGVGTKEKLMGVFYLEDKITQYAYTFIKMLKLKHKRPILCSGDSESHVKSIANALEIKEYYANMNPIDKSNLIQKLQSEKNTVCMIGDGINDAKAIAISDVGIAVSNALDVAKINTDIIISHGGLEKIIYLLDLTDKVIKNVKQNLFWAFIYNIIMIPFAAGAFSLYGFYIKPEFAGLAMGFSSVSVVLNALRLSKFKN